MNDPIHDHVLRSPEELQKCLLENDRSPDPDHTLAAIKHRQRLVRFWDISIGAKILEIGAGQGDCTVVLADAIGPDGMVTGLYIEPDNFGTPPLGAAHKHVKASVVGKQIDFVRRDAVTYLKDGDHGPFDYIVLSHCIWYFSDPSTLSNIFRLARRHLSAPTVLLAEYASVTSLPEAVPHVLAATAISMLESLMTTPSYRNIKCAVSPRQMREAATGKAGWAIRKEEYLEPKREQRDGFREVVMLLKGTWRKLFEDQVEGLELGEKTKTVLLAARDAVEGSVQGVDGGVANVRNMDVWVARFEVEAL